MKQLATGLIFFLLVLHFTNALPLLSDGGHGSSNDNGSGTMAKQFVLHNDTNVFPGNHVLQLDVLDFISSDKLLSVFELHIQNLNLSLQNSKK